MTSSLVGQVDRRAAARELRRQGGYSIRRIAVEVGIPRTVVHDWVRDVVPMEYVQIPAPVESVEDRRLRALRKLCSCCGESKPWSAFWAAAKNADGTMRRPQSRCKECVKARRRQRRREDPEWAREQNRSDWERIKRDPEKLARRRELTRENGIVHRLRRREVA